MWFKQVKLFQLTDSINNALGDLAENLEALSFKPCFPSMPQSVGWVSPIDEHDAPLVQTINGYTMICLQVEEKILPTTVIRQELEKRIKEIEVAENRKIRQKEKFALKDDIIATLLPRAFSKLTAVYAYIDTKNHWLILSTTNERKVEQFVSAFKKLIGEEIRAFEIKKLSSIMTNWLKHQNYPSSIAIEKSCVLQDPNQESRVVRCQQQDLFASSIQALIKDGCEVKQLALTWQDRLNSMLLDDFSFQGIKFSDEITDQVKEMEAETKQQRFHADFLIMTETLSGLLKELKNLLVNTEKNLTETGKVVSMVRIA